ncbi:MAG: glycosyltransferase [Patescibacteria group bacterium]
MKIALVYDRVNKWGGAERVLLTLHEIWPEAPLFTAVHNPKKASWSDVFKVNPSFLNKFPLASSHHEFYPWLTPLAFESFDLNSFDIVISVTSADAKGIITSPSAFHICYCLTPTRYLYSGRNDYFKGIKKIVFSPVINYLKAWDRVASFRPDSFISISETVQKRIKKYYQQESKTIYPPIETDKWQLEEKQREDFYLVVSRLVEYKRVDLAINAFNKLGKKLIIVGDGRARKKLEAMAKKNILFLGQLTDEELLRYYQKSKALIFAQLEDFGLVSLEAQSCGTPVIAFSKGGAMETVIDKRTGLFFNKQTKESLMRAVKEFERLEIKSINCRQNALRFNKERFKKEFKKEVLNQWMRQK